MCNGKDWVTFCTTIVQAIRLCRRVAPQSPHEIDAKPGECKGQIPGATPVAGPEE